MNEFPNYNDNHIKTFLRINPINKKNSEQNIKYKENPLNISNEGNYVYFNLSQGNKQQFFFDKIFNENETQKNIFDNIGKDLCSSFLQGFNSSIILYGKKNTGKTYSFLGKSISDVEKEFEEKKNFTNEVYIKYLYNRGIFPLCLENIFNNIFKNKDFSFSISMSCIEVFDNIIIDYFNIKNYINSEINFDEIFKKKYSYDLNFIRLKIFSSDEALHLLDQGKELRNFIFKEINMEEIHGHFIIILYADIINKETNQRFNSSFTFAEICTVSNIIQNNFNFSINNSLETFSYIIHQLSDNVKIENILYSNSILTNLFKESLGGNSKTSFITNISPFIYTNNNFVDVFQSLCFSSQIRKIINVPKINEIISKDIEYPYYQEILNKNERLKSEKDYLLNYISNINRNSFDKNMDNLPKKINNQNINQKKKEKNENLKKLIKDINVFNLKNEELENDLQYQQKEKNINLDKYNKINLSIFQNLKKIDVKREEINNINSKRVDLQKSIINYKNIYDNLESINIQKSLLTKENNIKDFEKINKFDNEISKSQMAIDDREKKLNSLKDKYDNLLEVNKEKVNKQKKLNEIKENLLNEKYVKEQNIEENKNKYNEIQNESKNIKQIISDKNSKFNNIQENLNQFKEYENNTINKFIIFCDNNNKREMKNNNKLYDMQKYIPQKEKELQIISNDIYEINQNKLKGLEEQEKIKLKINDYIKKSSIIENEIKLDNHQVNNLQEKLSVLTMNLNFYNYKDENISSKNEENNKDINSSIFSLDLSNNNSNKNTINNDFIILRNNLNFQLNESQNQQLFENKIKLLELEKKENIALKEKKNIINNEIYKFKINQLKNNSYNYMDKSHNQHNLVKIEENMDKINENEKLLKNYQSFVNKNYILINNYLNENNNENNDNDKDISINQFKTLFSKFIEKTNEIDKEFELVKNEFKDNEEEYRLTSKEIINTSLKNNPILKNYEELYNQKEYNNKILQNIKEEDKRITMNDNKILNDNKNLLIYNGIYLSQRNFNDYLKTNPEFKKSDKKQRNIEFYKEGENFDNNNNKKELSMSKSCNGKENKKYILNNSIFNTKVDFVDKKKNNNNCINQDKTGEKVKTKGI